MGKNSVEHKDIHFDFNFMMKEHIGEDSGFSPEDINFYASDVGAIHEGLQKRREEGELPFFDLPYKDTGPVKKLASAVRENFEHFLLIGIGGSALGPIAIQQALHPPFYNFLEERKEKGLPAMYFLDNIDPDEIFYVLKLLDLSKTAIAVITKSGSTAETMATFLILKEALRKAGRIDPSQIIAITDPATGILRKIALQEGYNILEIPPGVGGRFSVLTPVGLFSAAVSGIDIDEILAGAASMDKRCTNPDIWQNPAYMKALLEYMFHIRQGRNIAIMMAYSEALGSLVEWFAQLWAESLGKKYGLDGNVVYNGQTPVKAIGATDQHSQLQLYMEGPHDKTITFLRVENFRTVISIPKDYEDLEGVYYLGGHTLNELIHAEQRATEIALAKAGRPNCRIDIPEITPYTLGQLFYMFEVQTAFAGSLYKVNAFDQPGVEESKKLTFGMMGRKGFEDKKREVEGVHINKEYII